jgi:hypothetical protein
VAWQSVTNTAQSWTTTSASTPTWNGPSDLANPNRLARVYPQDSPVEDLSFIYRIQSEFPWFVATGNSILIRSSITEPIP